MLLRIKYYQFQLTYISLTFSNLSLTGFGLSAVTASAISWPILNASSLERPLSSMNMLQTET